MFIKENSAHVVETYTQVPSSIVVINTQQRFTLPRKFLVSPSGVSKTNRMKLTWHMILNVLIPTAAFCWCTSHACLESHAKIGRDNKL